MSVGSLGVAQWLDANLEGLFNDNRTLSVSGVVHCDFDEDFAVKATRLIAGPYTW